MYPPTSKRVRALIIVGVVSLSACIGTQPAPHRLDISASNRPDVVTRGRYLVHGPAHCVDCHGDPAGFGKQDGATEVRLSGGRRFPLGPLGTVVAPNITSDPQAGIGAWSDADIIRSLHYGIGHDGRTLVPVMPFADMADNDLQAVISYLRTLPPVAEPSPPSDMSWLGALALRLVVQPAAPSTAPATAMHAERSARYGRYLAHAVANCHGCHTRRSKLTGAYVGPLLAGGMKLEEQGTVFTSPNLTPVDGGVLQNLSEAQFIHRFRARGRRGGHSPMPWQAYARMTDTDLGAIYRYLVSLPPAPTPS